MRNSKTRKRSFLSRLKGRKKHLDSQVKKHMKIPTHSYKLLLLFYFNVKLLVFMVMEHETNVLLIARPFRLGGAWKPFLKLFVTVVRIIDLRVMVSTVIKLAK